MSLAACPLLWPVALLNFAVGTQWSLVLGCSSRPRVSLFDEARLHVSGLSLGRSWLEPLIAPSDLVWHHIIVGEVYQCWTLHVLDI